MTARGRITTSTFDSDSPARAVGFVSLAVLAAMLAIGPAVQAQTFTVLHTFTGGADGANPQDGLTIDQAGNLYGVTEYGGQPSSCPSDTHPPGCGVVFKMKHSGSGWTFSPVYNFVQNGVDGNLPYGRVVIGPDGALYGTTFTGGSEYGGIVFRMTPPATPCTNILCRWTETILYSFSEASGIQPYDIGGLSFDQAGNLYGTTARGGGSDEGVVFKMTPTPGSWTEQILYSWTDNEPAYPSTGVVLDPQGNIYGTLPGGCDPPGCYGTVFQLTNSGSGWAMNILHGFDGTYGQQPGAGLIRDAEGNLYGSTQATSFGGLPVFELTPSGGSWNYTVLSFVAQGLSQGPEGDLVMDGAGNLYGTTFSSGAHNQGNVFKLTPTANGWVYTDLYDFTGEADGGYPKSNVVIDANGDLYGTTSACGPYQFVQGHYWVVWEITP